jgi:phosphoglycerol geranylgeranyltransferase
VRDAIDIPLIVGGGIRTPEAASSVAKAGADIVVTGTVVERTKDGESLRKIIEAVKAA